MDTPRIESFILGELTDIEQFHDRQAQEAAAWETIEAWRNCGDITADEAEQIFYHYLQQGC